MRDGVAGWNGSADSHSVDEWGVVVTGCKDRPMPATLLLFCLLHKDEKLFRFRSMDILDDRINAFVLICNLRFG